MTGDEARRRFAAARVARLATADAAGRPHVVPFVFAVAADTIYSAVDHKPKRSMVALSGARPAALRRLANVAANPAVAALVDHYDDGDWDSLWWARADGNGRVIPPDAAEARRAVALLVQRYPQYQDRPPHGPVLALDVERWSGWSAR